MEDPTSPTTNPSTEAATLRTRGLAQSLGEQRRQIEEFLASRRERMDGVELELTDGLAQVVDELIRSRSETNIARDELESREARLQQEAEHIEQMRADLDAARTDLDAARADWEESRRATEKQQSMLLEQIQTQQQEQQQQHGRQLEETAQRQSALDEAREAFHAELKQRPGTDPDSARELEELRGQCKELRHELQQQPQDGGEYQKRYELSLEDIRELRQENKELKEELLQAKSRPQSPGADSSPAAGPLSWEAQKQQLLASLEGEYDANDPEDVKQRMQIDELVQKTDFAISQKDDEIQDLKKLLEDQSENIGAVAVGAAAFGEMLDNDQIIQEERTSLKQLKEELRKKLSTAEIDISVERAKIARQQVELEEKMRMLAQQQAGETPGEERQADDREKPVRGRWLSRLGLNDIEK